MTDHRNTEATADWITVGDLADGFAPEAFILPNLADLSGREHQLYFDNGRGFLHRFDDDTVTWRDADGGTGGSAPYRATSLRADIYLVDFLKNENGHTVSVSLVLDFAAGAFTAVLGTLPGEQDTREGLYCRALAGRPLTDVQARFVHGTIDTPWQTGACPHASTTELVGLRNLYRYSPTEVYEHIYLNEHFYTWQCVKGVEQGLCDTDRCHYIKIAADLYLFVWREKIIPTLGLVMIDLANHRSDGKLFGYAQSDFDKVSNFPVASYCSVLNTTRHPLDKESRHD